MRRNLQFLTAIVGALTLLATAAVYIATTTPALRKILAWKDGVTVLALDSGREIVLLNTGDGDVLVANLLLKVFSGERHRSINHPINKTLSPGEVAGFPLGESIGEGSSRFLTGPRVAATWVIVNGHDEASWKRQATRPIEGDPCYDYAVLLRGGTDYQHLEDALAPDFQTLEATAKLQIFSLEKKHWFSRASDVVGVLVWDARCASKARN